jgi:hypothetical protein
MDKLTIIDDNRFQYLFRHAEFGTVSPYMFIYHDCNPKVVSFISNLFRNIEFSDQRAMLCPY